MNQSSLNAPRYNATPIRFLGALARVLDVSEATPVALADQADNLYRVGKQIPKEVGTVCITYDALPNLKKYIEKLKLRFFGRSSFQSTLLAAPRARITKPTQPYILMQKF